MIARLCVAFFLVVAVMADRGEAADVRNTFTLQSAMQKEQVKNLLGGDVHFYWGKQEHPAITQTFGIYKSSERTTIGGRSQSDACAEALAKAIVRLRDRADVEGAGAIVNVVSNAKNIEESSETQYTCLVGRVMVNVALKGKVVNLAK